MLDAIELAARPFPDLRTVLMVALACHEGEPVGLVLVTHAVTSAGIEPDKRPLMLRTTSIPGLRGLIAEAREALGRVELGEGPGEMLLAEQRDLKLTIVRDRDQRRQWFLSSTDRQKLCWWPDEGGKGLDLMDAVLDEAEAELATVGHMAPGTDAVN